uniref:Uncharacterized protein n=1 Tax=Timema bartmani TaxID=61472 RepID=A0A7R9EYG1_9NEOP|nr:unnamed protein product [Timema bartmani]
MKFCSAMLLLSLAALRLVCGLSSFSGLEVNKTCLVAGAIYVFRDSSLLVGVEGYFAGYNVAYCLGSDDRVVRVHPTMEERVAAILTRLHLAEVEASWDSHTLLDIHNHVADDCLCVPWYEELDVTEQWLEDLKTFGRNLHDLLDKEDEDELFYTINQHLELSDLIMSYVYVMQVIKIGVEWNIFAFVEDIKNNVQLPNDIMEEIHLYVAQVIASLRDRCSEERKVVPDVLSNSFHSSLRFLLASIALSSPIEPAESHYNVNLVTLHRSHLHQTT